MNNYVQTGVNLTLPAPVNVVSGEGVIVGAIFGIAAETALAGGEVDLVTLGVFKLPKIAALAIAIGDRLYWDNATKLVTKTSAGNTYIGVASTDAANPTRFVNVRLSGAF